MTMHDNRAGRRLLGVVAGVAALSLGVATTASAHHCYKAEWEAAAAEQLASGKTPWVPLSDLADYYLGFEFPDCENEGLGDFAVAAWMAETGTVDEPLVHSRATAGGGAAHQGKTVKPFLYLDDADFDFIVGEWIKAGMNAGCIPPEPPA